MKAYGIYYQNLKEINTLAKKDPKAALKTLCNEFESLIWYEILKNFDQSIWKSNLFPETLEKKIYQDFLYQEVGRTLAGRPKSLGDYLYQNLLKSTYLKNRIEKSDK
ncbi:hypothetical protein F1847_06330 [Thermodesulfobacterium sp. TA1]|uniref:hypothetical protein n=1 Tax=Thermodesulfobacterium sp. TA1 TaxID=2234087 RepID=UPI0012323B4F|nr:hypothetical protein [Thermodesulfobacterium sp. TA1]QER42378.1 hypothetical protein F1847_06330 [Thermodesulfobacterium sp. TA1]